jgi:hypothetical protein
MRHSAEGKHDSVIQRLKASPLCWAARLLALGYGLFIALYVLGTGFPTVTGYASRGEMGELVSSLLRWLFFYFPLVPAAIIAWRWHLAGGILLIAAGAAVCVGLALSSGMQWPVYLFALPIFAGSLLHLLVWYREKRADRMPQLSSREGTRQLVKGKSDRAMQHHKTSPLCWAARLLSLGYGLFIALYALGAGSPIVIEYASRGEIEKAVSALLNWLPFFIPLVPAVIAWRWHLVGGTLITAASVAFYLVFMFSSGTQWGAYVCVIPVLAGGLLHLVVWYKERRTNRIPLPA